MRILSGSLHNQRVKIPSSSEIRPTSSKLRGQVFNICREGIEGGYALDLFAGSGAMGIEAISRGAIHCTFVEHDHRTAATLKANLASLHLEGVTRVLSMDAQKALHILSSTPHPFSFVYIDPPYALIEPIQAILHTIDTLLPLVSGAYVFLETRKKAFTPEPLSTLALVTHRTSGDSDLWHFEKCS